MEKVVLVKELSGDELEMLVSVLGTEHVLSRWWADGLQ